MKNSYLLNIAGTAFSIFSDEKEDYIRLLEADISEMVEAAMKSGASGHKAALFVCMELRDMLEKSKIAAFLREGESERASASAFACDGEMSKRQKKSADRPFFPDRGQVSLFDTDDVL